MSRFSANWIVEAYTTFRLSLEQISDIAEKEEMYIQALLEKRGVLGGNSKKLKKVSLRKRNKIASLIYLGNKCKICKYSKCEAALEFHHIHMKDKSYNISSGFNRPWAELKRELDKCMIVCCNCHKEIHYKKKGLI